MLSCKICKFVSIRFFEDGKWVLRCFLLFGPNISNLLFSFLQQVALVCCTLLNRKVACPEHICQIYCFQFCLLLFLWKWKCPQHMYLPDILFSILSSSLFVKMWPVADRRVSPLSQGNPAWHDYLPANKMLLSAS